jgi:hypothetical protein
MSTAPLKPNARPASRLRDQLQETTMHGISFGLISVAALIFAGLLFSSGVRVVRPTSRGLAERLDRWVR